MDEVSLSSHPSMVIMQQHSRRRSYTYLFVLILLAILYYGVLFYHHTLTGTNRLDGIIGVLLGLYIISLPAANLFDILFFERDILRQAASEWPVFIWILLNILVIIAGWLVLVVATTRFTMR